MASVISFARKQRIQWLAQVMRRSEDVVRVELSSIGNQREKDPEGGPEKDGRMLWKKTLIELEYKNGEE